MATLPDYQTPTGNFLHIDFNVSAKSLWVEPVYCCRKSIVEMTISKLNTYQHLQQHTHRQTDRQTDRHRPIGPSSSSSAGWSMMCLNIGSRNASVFPLPVLAMPMTSRPDMMAGIAWDWIGVGFSKPLLFTHSHTHAVSNHEDANNNKDVVRRRRCQLILVSDSHT